MRNAIRWRTPGGHYEYGLLLGWMGLRCTCTGWRRSSKDAFWSKVFWAGPHREDQVGCTQVQFTTGMSWIALCTHIGWRKPCKTAFCSKDLWPMEGQSNEDPEGCTRGDPAQVYCNSIHSYGECHTFEDHWRPLWVWFTIQSKDKDHCCHHQEICPEQWLAAVARAGYTCFALYVTYEIRHTQEMKFYQRRCSVSFEIGTLLQRLVT